MTHHIIWIWLDISTDDPRCVSFPNHFQFDSSLAVEITLLVGSTYYNELAMREPLEKTWVISKVGVTTNLKRTPHKILNNKVGSTEILDKITMIKSDPEASSSWLDFLNCLKYNCANIKTTWNDSFTSDLIFFSKAIKWESTILIKSFLKFLIKQTKFLLSIISFWYYFQLCWFLFQNFSAFCHIYKLLFAYNTYKVTGSSFQIFF